MFHAFTHILQFDMFFPILPVNVKFLWMAWHRLFISLKTFWLKCNESCRSCKFLKTKENADMKTNLFCYKT